MEEQFRENAKKLLKILGISFPEEMIYDSKNPIVKYAGKVRWIPWKTIKAIFEKNCKQR